MKVRFPCIVSPLVAIPGEIPTHLVTSSVRLKPKLTRRNLVSMNQVLQVALMMATLNTPSMLIVMLFTPHFLEHMYSFFYLLPYCVFLCRFFVTCDPILLAYVVLILCLPECKFLPKMFRYIGSWFPCICARGITVPSYPIQQSARTIAYRD